MLNNDSEVKIKLEKNMLMARQQHAMKVLSDSLPRVKCLTQEHNTVNPTVAGTRLLELESSMVTYHPLQMKSNLKSLCK